MIEPQPGDCVMFRESGAKRPGTVVEVITAGKPTGVGEWRLRRRARIRFEVAGHHWETYRDLTEIAPFVGQTGLPFERPA